MQENPNSCFPDFLIQLSPDALGNLAVQLISGLAQAKNGLTVLPFNIIVSASVDLTDS